MFICWSKKKSINTEDSVFGIRNATTISWQVFYIFITNCGFSFGGRSSMGAITKLLLAALTPDKLYIANCLELHPGCQKL